MSVQRGRQVVMLSGISAGLVLLLLLVFWKDLLIRYYPVWVPGMEAGNLTFMLVAPGDEQTEERIKEIQAEEEKYLIGRALHRLLVVRRFFPLGAPPEFVARPEIETEEGPGGRTVVREKINQWGNRLTVLHNADRLRVSGAHVSRAVESSDDQGRPALAFGLDPAGATKLANLTGANKSRLLAIVLDDKIRQVATIVSRIYDSVQLTGSFSSEEVREIVTLLKDGATSRSR